MSQSQNRISIHFQAEIQAIIIQLNCLPARFDIKSFVYRARKPFHPGRLNDLMLEPFFIMGRDIMDDEEGEEAESDEEGEEAERTEEEKKRSEELKQVELLKVQEKAAVKQRERKEVMGELLRSKGFLWMATSMDVMAGWQQAGNVVRIDAENPWMCLVPDIWKGGDSIEKTLFSVSA